MRNQTQAVRCTLLNGSAWSTEFLRSYKGTFDIFLGIEHRMRKMEMGEQFNKESKQGWRFATDAARITDKKNKQSYLSGSWKAGHRGMTPSLRQW